MYGYLAIIHVHVTLQGVHGCTFYARPFSCPGFVSLKLLQDRYIVQVYTALNVLGELPWIINTRVLDAVKTAYSMGGGLGGLPSLDPKPLVPKPVFKRFRVERRKGQLQVTVSPKI